MKPTKGETFVNGHEITNEIIRYNKKATEVGQYKFTIIFTCMKRGNNHVKATVTK